MIELSFGAKFVKRLNAIALIFLMPALASASPPGWAPCGGGGDKLWSWSWVGENGDNVETASGSKSGKQGIVWMGDLSGNGRHYHNTTGEKVPAYDSAGLTRSSTWGSYQTNLIPFMRDNYADGSRVYSQALYQEDSLNAGGPFYTVFAGMHTRGNGIRQMFGSDPNHYFSLDQDDSRVQMKAGDSFDGWITIKEAIPRGPMVLEIWRDSSNVMRVEHNGVEVGNGTVVSGTFDVSGFGWNTSGSSGWDDYAFEILVCDGLPTVEQRGEAREYLRTKWNLYGEVNDPLAPPGPPVDVEVN